MVYTERRGMRNMATKAALPWHGEQGKSSPARLNLMDKRALSVKLALLNWNYVPARYHTTVVP